METVLIAGGSGLIGQRLAQLLLKEGYRAIILTRKVKNDSLFDQIEWNIKDQEIDPSFAGVDHIINLAGAGIADKRWSNSRKSEILDSRIQSTHFLKIAIERHQPTIKTFISSSAVGYYGDTGLKRVDEEGLKGDDFLAEVCQKWEEEAMFLPPMVGRLVIIRIGVVLSKTGGALGKMAQTVPLGIASYPGKGDQFLPWIHIDDLCQIFIHLLKRKDLKGTFNGVAPEPIQQKEFVAILKNQINPRAIHITAPIFALKLALGEMSSVILNSNNVSAQKIVDTGFEFLYPHAEEALAAIYT